MRKIRSVRDCLVIKESPVIYDKEFGIKIYMSELYDVEERKTSPCWSGVKNGITREITYVIRMDDGLLFTVKDYVIDIEDTSVLNNSLIWLEFKEDGNQSVTVDEHSLESVESQLARAIDATEGNLTADAASYLRLALNISVANALGLESNPPHDRAVHQAGCIFHRVMNECGRAKKFNYTGLVIPDFEDVLNKAIDAVHKVAKTCNYTNHTPIGTINNDMLMALTDEVRALGYYYDFTSDKINEAQLNEIKVRVTDIHFHL